MSNKSTAKKTINLALQGGGTHGAYAWGALDMLLEDGRVDVEGISATSAGSVNACAYAYGMHSGGPEKAREILHDVWHSVSKQGEFFSPVRRTFLDQVLFPDSDNSLSYMAFDAVSRSLSPEQFNPMDINPLRDILAETIDFEALQNCGAVKLFISATHVATGKAKIFKTDKITLDVVMASAALPDVFKAVRIDGEDYWDGGYVGNPSLYPLFYNTDARDIMIVHINPLNRKKTPETSAEIANRINEISFNSSLIEEIRAVAFVKKLLDRGMLKKEFEDEFKNILLHSIRADGSLCDLSIASKFDSSWDFLTMLRDRGRDSMRDWLAENFDKIGKKTTIDLYEDYLSPPNEIS